MKNNLTALSIFCLALSIVIGSWLISNRINVNQQSPSQSILLTQSELASYLGLSIEEVTKLGPTKEEDGSYTSVLPYLKIGNKVYFSKSAVDKWLTNNEGYGIK
ncbi:helix-turn-helix domain-containing protein [Bacillus sp. BRMEA1]|uniref:helix-turn-helix domain-containing protein n=1 Tax=Neobacillus endophyticus TaxID=2738405 RepID=UPI001562F24C|nr:helix-turn-helix domain-containing protein [Neobacillus endophyticus]NRD76605.1 helix-turn-helix domain-containing protein [Neobacillus endophyticus]